MQFQICLNTVWQAATKCSDADWQRAKVQLEHNIDQVTTVKQKVLEKKFQHLLQWPLQKYRTKATGPRSTFTNPLTEMNTAAEEEVYRAANVTANRLEEFLVRLSDVSMEAATWSITNMDCCESVEDRDLWYHFEWEDGFQEGILPMIDTVECLVAGN